MSELVLFPICPVPRCRNLVDDPREVCPECMLLFGPYLRPAEDTPSAEEFTVALAVSDAQVAKVMAARAGPRRNQHCWVCEDRRTCCPDSDHLDRWICKTCAGVE